MRKWLTERGIKFRRFPLWLQIFNLFIASILLMIVLAGLYFLGPWSEDAAELFVDGRLDHAVLRELLAAGEHERVTEAIERLPPSTRTQVVRELGALCEPEAVPLLVALREAELCPELADVALARWRRAKIEIGERSEALLRRARLAVKGADGLEHHLALGALERLDDRRGALLVLALFEKSAAGSEQGRGARALLVRWLGEGPPERSAFSSEMEERANGIEGVLKP